MIELTGVINKLKEKNNGSFLAYAETEPHIECFFIDENGNLSSEIKPRQYIRKIGSIEQVITRKKAMHYQKYYGYMAGDISSVRICLCDKPKLKFTRVDMVLRKSNMSTLKLTSIIENNRKIATCKTLGQGLVRP